jgi:hypothetical protein
MIADLDETLKQLLIKKVPLNPAEVNISFDMPGREWSAAVSKPTVNIYLYDIHENHDLRNNEWRVERNNGIATKKKPPVRVDLSYLITVWTNDTYDQHRLLAHLLATLFRYPELPEELLPESLKGLEYPLSTATAQPDGVLRNSADFWSALDNQLRPSINYVVTVPVSLDVAFSAPIVHTKTFKFQARGAPVEQIVQIGGIVHRKGKPDQSLSGATVLVQELQMTAITDSEGRYIFKNVDQGSYTFKVSAPGLKEHQVQLMVPSASYDLEL